MGLGKVYKVKRPYVVACSEVCSKNRVVAETNKTNNIQQKIFCFCKYYDIMM